LPGDHGDEVAFAVEYGAYRNLEVARRRVRVAMARRGGAATAEELAHVRYRHDVAWAVYRHNEDELKLTGYGARLRPPPDWWEVEAELFVEPVSVISTVASVASDERASEELLDDGRVDRWRMPTASFWYVLEQRVKKGNLVSVHGLSEQTRRKPTLPFVGRTRVGNLVDWIDAHPEQAQRALALHEMPAGFRATADGVLVPPPPNAASLRAPR
jgi:hypothetical protein